MQTSRKPAIGLAAPLGAALFSAAEQGRLRWSIGTAAVLLAVSTTQRILEGDDPAYVPGFESVTTVGLMAAAIALGDSVRARRGWRADLTRREHAAALERDRQGPARPARAHGAGDLAAHRRGPRVARPGAATRLDVLTDREGEVLAEVGAGRSNAEIGRRLSMSPATARTHVGRLLAKLGALDRTQLVVLAYETGLITPGVNSQQ